MRTIELDRKESLGGTCSSAVLGLNPYQSRFDVWMAKVGEEVEPFVENRWVYWGLMKEKVIAEHYAKRYDVPLIESPKRVDVIPWMTGTPDRLLLYQEDNVAHQDLGFYDDPISGNRLVRRGLEIKTALSKKAPLWHPKGGVGISDRGPWVVIDYADAQNSVPLNYWLQCQWYMSLMDFKQWDLCVLLDSSDYREYRLLYDETFMKKGIEECRRFWEYNVAKKVPPPVDGGKMVNKFLAKKYGEHSDRIREGTEMDNILAERLHEVGTNMKKLIDEDKHWRGELHKAEDTLCEVRKELDEVKKENDELCSTMRDRIGTDAGVQTTEGVLKWTKSGDRPRTLRKTWNKKLEG